MNFIKSSLVGLLASVLTVTLLIFGITFGLHQVFGTPTAVKHALKDSGFYTKVVTLALDKAQKEQATGQQAIPIDRQEVEQKIQKSISPAYLQSQTEKTLDSVYDWLHGKSPTLNFAINAGDTKARLANGLSDYITQHLTALPTCAPGTAASDDIDPFAATCLPAGFDIGTAAAKAKDQLLGSGFLQDGELNAANIKTNDGKTLEDQVRKVPQMYHWVVWGIYGAGLLALLSALGVIFLSKTRRSGIKKVAIIAIPIGVLMTLMGWLASFGAGKAMAAAKEPIQQTGVQIGQLLANDLRLWWMGYGTTLLALGIGSLVALHFTKGKLEAPIKSASEMTDGSPEPSAVAEHLSTTTPPRPRPKPARKLVQ
jgi:hypothetical protein